MCAAKKSNQPKTRQDELKALEQNIKAFQNMQDELEAGYLHRWVVFHDQQFIGAFDSFHDAAVEATKRFGRGPYLIRQVGRKHLRLPASILYRPINA